MSNPKTEVDALKEAMLLYAPELTKDYKEFVKKQFKAMQEDLGTNLKGVYNSSRWANIFRGIRPNLTDYTINSARLEKNAKEYGERVALEWCSKMRSKLGMLKDVTVSEPNNTGKVTIKGKHEEDSVLIEQQRIINISKLGTLFHQFPAHIYVNRKFVSEAKYKGIADSWGVSRVEVNKPKRPPIDPDSRPKQFYFTFMVDYPATSYGPARTGEYCRKSTRGMTEEEALAKLKKHEEGMDKDYPPSAQRRLYDFKVDVIYAWNDRPLWKASMGIPKPTFHAIATKKKEKRSSPTVSSLQ